MATPERSSQRLPLVPEPAVAGESPLPTGRELAEANRFAYAALCGISLSQLFPEPEHSSFCAEFVAGLVKWLELPEAVLPTMTAFAKGLGGEGADMFAPILLKDPILKDDPLVIVQDLLSFSLKDGRYDARARVLICHMTSVFRVPLGELDLLEETFLESLKETKEEESEPPVPPSCGAALLSLQGQLCTEGNYPGHVARAPEHLTRVLIPEQSVSPGHSLIAGSPHQARLPASSLSCPMALSE